MSLEQKNNVTADVATAEVNCTTPIAALKREGTVPRTGSAAF